MNTLELEERRPLVFIEGIPARTQDFRWAYQKKLAVYCILASTLFERIAFNSLIANIVLLLKISDDFDWDPSDSATALYIFSGMSYIFTIIFAAVSDAKLGRAKTIGIGFIPYFIGFVMLILILHKETTSHLCHPKSNSQGSVFHEKCAASILSTLFLTAIGVGAVQANMAVFGAEQIQGLNTASRYFDIYFAASNIGGVIAMTLIPYIASKEGYATAMIYATGALFLSVVCFLIGCRSYIHVIPFDTVMTKCFPVVISACQSWRRYRQERQMRKTDESMEMDQPSWAFLDFAKIPFRGKFHGRIVDNVKTVPSALATFAILIPFWLVFNQLDVTFPLQGEQMSIPYDQDTKIKWMSLGDPLIIVVGIFLLNVFVYKRLKNDNPVKRLTIKLVIGMSLACLTMCIAGTVEAVRWDQCGSNLTSNASNMSIYYQLPQYVGMGLSEMFTSVASYEFAYLAAPRAAQSLFMSLRFCSSGIASFIAIGYVQIFSTKNMDIDFSCVGDENQRWTTYTYFYVLAAIQFVFIFILIFCQRKFHLIKLNPEKMENTVVL